MFEWLITREYHYLRELEELEVESLGVDFEVSNVGSPSLSRCRFQVLLQCHVVTMLPTRMIVN